MYGSVSLGCRKMNSRESPGNKTGDTLVPEHGATERGIIVRRLVIGKRNVV